MNVCIRDNKTKMGYGIAEHTFDPIAKRVTRYIVEKRLQLYNSYCMLIKVKFVLSEIDCFIKVIDVP